MAQSRRAVLMVLAITALAFLAGCGPTPLQMHFDSSAKQVGGQAPIIAKPEVRYVHLAAKDGSGQNLDPLRYAVPGAQAKGKQVVSPANAQAKLTMYITRVWTERAPASGGGATLGAVMGGLLGSGIAVAAGAPPGAALFAGFGGATVGGAMGQGIEQSNQPVVVKAQIRLTYEEWIALEQSQPDEPVLKKKQRVKIVTRKGKKIKVYEEDIEAEESQAAVKKTISVAPQGGGMMTVTTDRRHTNWTTQFSDHTVEVQVPANTSVEQVKEMLNQQIGALMSSVF